MHYTVINGDISVKKINISFVSTSSVIFVGDVNKVSLSSTFETPPEDNIVDIEVPLIE
jgi:hypothetical protein